MATMASETYSQPQVYAPQTINSLPNFSLPRKTSELQQQFPLFLPPTVPTGPSRRRPRFLHRPWSDRSPWFHLELASDGPTLPVP